MGERKFVESIVRSPSSSITQSSSMNSRARTVKCDCGRRAPIRTATTSRNRGKKFYGCFKYNEVDGSESEGLNEVKNGDENHDMENQLKLLGENRELRIDNRWLMEEVEKLKNREKMYKQLVADNRRFIV
ncbi:hypothetical protein PTKIN_Ptkin17bG0082400 [Pterospermum kingtungense]